MRCMIIREMDLCCVMSGWRLWAAIQVFDADLQRLKGFTAVCALVPCGALPVGICQGRPGTVPGVREDTIASQARQRHAQRRPCALAADSQKWRQYSEASQMSLPMLVKTALDIKSRRIMICAMSWQAGCTMARIHAGSAARHVSE